MSDKPKTFEDYRETGRMVQGWNVGSDEYPSDWKSGEKGWNAGRESRDAEVADLQAKLREAEAACAGYEQCLKVIAYGEGKIEDKGEHYCNSLTDARTFATAQLEDYVGNHGAPLLARLQAADELAEASAQILRACASSFPRVFSNAQFILGEKLQAYKAS